MCRATCAPAASPSHPGYQSSRCRICQPGRRDASAAASVDLPEPEYPSMATTGMRHGVLWSVLYTVVLVGLAYAHFRRKDVLS